MFPTSTISTTTSTCSNLLLAPTSRLVTTLPACSSISHPSPKTSPFPSIGKFSNWYSPRYSRRSGNGLNNLTDLLSLKYSSSVHKLNRDVNNLMRFLRGESVELIFEESFKRNLYLYVGADLMKLDNPHEEISYADTGFSIQKIGKI